MYEDNNEYEVRSFSGAYTGGEDFGGYAHVDSDYGRSIETENTQKKKRPRRGGAAALGVILAVLVAVSAFAGGRWLSVGGADVQGSLPERQTTANTPEVRTQSYYPLTAGEGLTVPQVYQKVVESVVAISCELEVESSAPNSFYFGYGYGYGQDPMPRSGSATGTGIVFSEDGYIITNHHVVEDAIKITVTTHDGSEYTAELVGSDENTDIAVIKIAASGLIPAEFGDSASVIVGEAALVVGNPLGSTFAETLTTGVISSTARTITINQSTMTLIQTDAAVNPGNSGGPLANSRGQVVGVVNAKISRDDVEGIGFAIPSNTAVSIASDMINYGYVASRPMLGIIVRSVTSEQAAYYGLEPGITVTEVSEDSAAAEAGIEVGDKIIAFNGVAVSTSAELNYEKEKCRVGDTATITVMRGGQSMDLSITLKGGKAN